jgi:HPr kinase/phosphorylase
MPSSPRPMPSEPLAGLSQAPREVTVSVRELMGHPELAGFVRLCAGGSGLDRRIDHPRVQKSGLVLVGHTQGVVPTRVQVFGETELSFLDSLEPHTRAARVEFVCGLGLSLIVVTRGVEPSPELVAAATRHGTPLAVASERSSGCINQIHGVLDRLLAPRARVHGVLVEVHGVGTLLCGPSGIGKSECALFLVQRGHRLVADDVVELTRLPSSGVMGAPAPLLRHHLEIRGMGILNIRDLFGATAVRDHAQVDLVVELCTWSEDDQYERLGLDDQTLDVLGSEVARLRIPVRPGRDMGVLLEMAARNHLLKREGVHGARRFAERLERESGRRAD